MSYIGTGHLHHAVCFLNLNFFWYVSTSTATVISCKIYNKDSTIELLHSKHIFFVTTDVLTSSTYPVFLSVT